MQGDLDAPACCAPDARHRGAPASAWQRRAALNVINFLANHLDVAIVAVGTHEALHAMRHHPQFASRYEL